MRLADLVHHVGGTLVAGGVMDDPVVHRAVEDHRAAGPGDLFVALQGGRGHGARHAAAAVGTGAAAVLADPRGAQLLGRGVEVPVVVVEDPRTALGPVAARLHGGQHRVDGVRYDVVAFTNLTHEHLDHHGGMASYFGAKARLFTPGFTSRAVVVVDDGGRRLRDLAGRRGVSVVSPGSHPEADAQWHVVGERGDDAFCLRGPDGGLALRTPLPGGYNRTNTAVAALVLLVVTVGSGGDRDPTKRGPAVAARRSPRPARGSSRVAHARRDPVIVPDRDDGPLWSGPRT